MSELNEVSCSFSDGFGGKVSAHADDRIQSVYMDKIIYMVWLFQTQ